MAKFIVAICDDDELSREHTAAKIEESIQGCTLVLTSEIIDVLQMVDLDVCVMDKILADCNGSDYVDDIQASVIIYSGIADESKNEIRKPNIDELIKRIESVRNAG